MYVHSHSLKIWNPVENITAMRWRETNYCTRVSLIRYLRAKNLCAVIEHFQGNITDAHFHSRWQNSCFVSHAAHAGTYLYTYILHYMYTHLFAYNPQGGTDRRKEWLLHKRDLHPAEGNAMLYSCGVSGRDLWTFCNDGDNDGLDDDLRINTYWA